MTLSDFGTTLAQHSLACVAPIDGFLFAMVLVASVALTRILAFLAGKSIAAVHVIETNTFRAHAHIACRAIDCCAAKAAVPLLAIFTIIDKVAILTVVAFPANNLVAIAAE